MEAAGKRIRWSCTLPGPVTGGEKTETVNPTDAVHERDVLEYQMQGSVAGAIHVFQREEHPPLRFVTAYAWRERKLCQGRGECPNKPVAVEAPFRTGL